MGKLTSGQIVAPLQFLVSGQIVAPLLIIVSGQIVAPLLFLVSRQIVAPLMLLHYIVLMVLGGVLLMLLSHGNSTRLELLFYLFIF